MLLQTTQVNGIDSCDAVTEWNTLVAETQNSILDTGQTLESGTPSNKQLQIAMAIYASSSTYFNCTNTGNAYSLAIIGSKQAGNAYIDGEIIRFRPSANNTGASTVTRGGFAVKDIVTQGGVALVGGELRTTHDALARYSTALGKYILLNNSLNDIYNVNTTGAVVNSLLQFNGTNWVAVAGSALPTEYIQGLVLENEAGDPINDINVNIGKARAKDDSTDIVLPSALIKQIDSNWGLGSNAGGFPSGLTLGSDIWYHFFVISKPDGTADAGFDTSLTATNLLGLSDAGASGFTKYRRVGSVLTDGSANIIQFTQYGNDFIWNTKILDYSATTGIPTTATDLTLTTPLGIKTKPKVNLLYTNSANVLIYFIDKTSGLELAVSNTSSAGQRNAEVFEPFYTDTSSTLQHYSTASTATDYQVYSYGYIDNRID